MGRERPAGVARFIVGDRLLEGGRFDGGERLNELGRLFDCRRLAEGARPVRGGRLTEGERLVVGVWLVVEPPSAGGMLNPFTGTKKVVCNDNKIYCAEGKI